MSDAVLDIILKAIEKDLYEEEDGLVYYYPKGTPVSYDSYHLRLIADELDKRNKPWLDEIGAYFESQKAKEAEVEFKAPQLEWIAKQYPNVGTWLSACDRFSVHVTDKGRFYACMAGWVVRPHPWDGDNEFDTFAKATGYCETYAAPLPSVQPEEEV